MSFLNPDKHMGKEFLHHQKQIPVCTGMTNNWIVSTF